MRLERDGTSELAGAAGRTWDAIVVGAGPAGAISAFSAARSGAATLLVERKSFPRAKTCGGCLNASAVALLDSLALGEIARACGLPINHLWLGLRKGQARIPLPGGIAIPRTHLDAALVRCAREAGAVFLPETRAVLGDEADGCREVTLIRHERAQVARGRSVVLASGLGGAALGHTELFSTRVARGSRIGAGCVVDRFPDEYVVGRISMGVGRSGYVGLTRTIDGLAIASATDAGFLKSSGGPARAAAAILEEAGFPPVPSMLEAEWMGTLPLTRSTRPVAASRVFLVGDAAGYVEPFTGQGMAIALQSAVALAPYVSQAIRGWSPAIARAWSRDHRGLVRSRFWPAALVAQIARNPCLARAAFALVRAMPIVPDALVQVVNRPVSIHPVI
jgi:flavin-dependent dehydrogenase